VAVADHIRVWNHELGMGMLEPVTPHPERVREITKRLVWSCELCSYICTSEPAAREHHKRHHKSAEFSFIHDWRTFTTVKGYRDGQEAGPE